MKSIYEVALDSGALLDKITYRQYLETIEQGTSSSGIPTKYARQYEERIAKLMSNLEVDTETVLVEYRDI